MTILTTFPPLYERFHGMSCDSHHSHQPIEGSCRNNKGEVILRTQFTEIYPRKFARSVAQLFLRKGNWWPFHWHAGMSLISTTRSVDNSVDDAQVLTSKFRGKSQLALSELISPTAHAMPGAKRARLDQRNSEQPSLEACKELIQKVDKILPRVGKREITDESVLQQLQNLFPEKHVVRVMSCRGTDRTMGPPDKLHPQEAPYRKMLILRRNGDVQHEKNWEK